jgi:hypothetical protein
VSTVILVPRRADGGHRDRLWAFCRERWERHFPDWPIVEGSHDDGPFNRSAAVNAAAARATAEHPDWATALIIDSDTVSDPRAIRQAVAVALQTGAMVVGHDERVMLTKDGTRRILEGYDGSWRSARFVEKVWQDSVSCAVAVSRTLWDEVGGFDEGFVGWGREDTAFRIACEVHGGPILKVSGETFHLWHPVAEEVAARHPLRVANEARHQAYVAARWNLEAVRELQREALDLPPTRIPRILHRTLPEAVDPEVEARWNHLRKLHPGWVFRTHREPLDPADWPLTGDLFDQCTSGAQKAGLVRLECLVREGGVYVDADVVGVRSLEPLLHVPAFGAWEDSDTLPDAVLGAEPEHPAFLEMIDRARTSMAEHPGDAWKSGPGVTTAVLPGRTDVLVLGPDAFYPCHYLDMARMPEVLADPPPATFLIHLYEHSWGTAAEKAALKAKQRL